MDCWGLNEATPPQTAAVLDLLELQHELESRAAKWCHHRHCKYVSLHSSGSRVQATFTWRSVQYTWKQMPQGWRHSLTICHGLIQITLENGEALEHLQYIDDITVWTNTAGEIFKKVEKKNLDRPEGWFCHKSK